MFETIKRIYNKTGNIEVIKKAVEKNWITSEHYYEITGILLEKEGAE